MTWGFQWVEIVWLQGYRAGRVLCSLLTVTKTVIAALLSLLGMGRILASAPSPFVCQVCPSSPKGL